MRKARSWLLALTIGAVGLVGGAPASADPAYTLTISDATAVEGTVMRFAFTVTPTPGVGDEVRLRLQLSDITAQGAPDCLSPNGTQLAGDYDTHDPTHFGPGLLLVGSSFTVDVPICDDALVEPTETFVLAITSIAMHCDEGPSTPQNPCEISLANNDGVAVGTIIDNEEPGGEDTPQTPTPDPVPGPTTLAAVDVNGPTGKGGDCVFNINRLGDASKVTTVNFFSSGKAKLVSNVSGTLVFAVGETVRTVHVDVLRRPRRTKFVTLTLTGASNATISDAVALCQLKPKRQRR